MMQRSKLVGRLRPGIATVALLLAAQACSDSTTPARVDDVDIGGAPSTALTVGDTVRLSVSVGDDQGGTVTNPAVSWQSTAQAVATVSASGLVTATGPGAARIVASVDGVADSVDVTVQAKPVSSCTSAIDLAVGAIQQVDAASAACLGGTSGAEFVVVGFNGQDSTALGVTVEANGLAASLAPVARTPLELLRPARSFGRGGGRDVAFEARLRQRERTELPRYLPALRAARRAGGMRPRLNRAAAVPAVGDLLSLNTAVENACAAPTGASRSTGRVAAVTTRAIVVTDTANPAGGFTDAEYQDIGLTFDTLVYAEDTRNFGEPYDIDANQRIIIYYTRAVNEMTEEDSESYVGGFFFARDLFPKTDQPDFQGCAGSNYGEMFYVLAPDPTGIVKNNKRAKQDVRDITIATIAHELQHLISASRRLYGLNTDNWDEVVWLNEGLSHIAEELVFYRASGLSPKMNLDSVQIRTREPGGSERRRLAFNEYQGDNFGRYETFLEDPEGNGPYEEDDDLETRGAAWAFLRYAADRVGTSQTALWNKLVNSQLLGMENLRAALGTDPIPLVRDWSVAVYADDQVAGIPAIFQQPSWNFRSMFRAFGRSTYPLKVRTLAAGATSISLAPGGATYLRVAPPGNSIASVRFRAGAAAPPKGFTMTVIRTK